VSTDAARLHQLVAAQITQVWGQGRLDLLPELYADDVVDHSPLSGQAGGREGLRVGVEAFRAAFPDLAMELHGTLADGDTGVDWWTLTGTHRGPLGALAATGRSVRFSGSDVVRVRDGRIAELWHVEDMLALALQLAAPGTAPADAVRALA